MSEVVFLLLCVWLPMYAAMQAKRCSVMRKRRRTRK